MYLFAWLVQFKHPLKKASQLILIQGGCLLPMLIEGSVLESSQAVLGVYKLHLQLT